MGKEEGWELGEGDEELELRRLRLPDWSHPAHFLHDGWTNRTRCFCELLQNRVAS